MLPSYQQQQHKYSSDTSSGQNNQSAGNPTWQRTPQSSDWQSVDQQQYRRPQQNQQNNVRAGYNGYPSSQNWNSNDPRSRNVSASYMDNGSPRSHQYDSVDTQASGYASSETMQYGPSQRGYSGYGNSGVPAWRLSMLPKQNTTSVQYGRQAVVTPDAVYIDRSASNSPSESIGPGRMTYGRSLPSAMVSQGNTLPAPTPAVNGSNEVIGPGQADGEMTEGPMDGGHMMMDHYGDGFTNPYCNSCNGCGGCDQGPMCGGQCGGCCDDCCDDGCGGHEHPPYGRPWILAPFDWLFGELSDCHHGWWWAEDLTLFAGAQNFKNIADGGLNSSFGFNQGVNWGVPIFPDLGISGQVGYEGVESEFESPIGSRLQSFLTIGLFHRPWCDECWDAGVVFDWLHDDFFGNSFDIGQIRGQLGWQWNRRNELGFWFGTGVMQSSGFRVLDQYNFFYRRQFCRGGDWRIWGGFTGGNGQTAGGIFGSDFEIPIARRWAFEGGFNYYIPTDSGANGGLAQETWNVGCNLVWYLGGTAQCTTPYRPLFDVANNGSLMTTLR